MTVLHSTAQGAEGILSNLGDQGNAAAAAMAKHLRELLTPATPEEEAIAAEVPVDDDLELDDQLFACDFSHTDNGCWVRVWVWVPNE